MDNPFKGHQVGNCNRFTSTHYSANAFAVTGAQEQAHCASKIVSNSYPFHSKSADIPIPIIRLLKMCPRQSEIKIMGEVKVDSHNLGPLFYRLTSFWFHVNPPAYSYDRAFLIWPIKWKTKDMAQCQIVGIISHHFISGSFHVYHPSRSWDTAISKTDLENPRSMSWVRSQFKVIMWV